MPALTKTLKTALAYWCSLRGSRRMPSRGDVDPADMRSLLPYVYLLDVEGASRFRYRLIGQNIIENLHDNATGRAVDRDLFGEGADEIVAMYDFVRESGRPVLNRGRAFCVDDFWRRYASLILPLSEDGIHVNKILGVMEFEMVREKPAEWRDDIYALWRAIDPDQELASAAV